MERTNPLSTNKLYQLLTWQNKIQTVFLIAFINVFFYYYVVFGVSFINLLTRVVLAFMLFKMIVPSVKKEVKDDEEDDQEGLTEDALKQLYVIVYVALNQAV